MTTLSVGSVDYERFGLTADEYDKCRFNLYLPSYHIYKDENEFSVLYFDSDDGVALISSSCEMFEEGLSIRLIDCQYCDIETKDMSVILSSIEDFNKDFLEREEE